MRRITGTLAALAVSASVLTACSSSDEDYCEALPEYFSAMSKSMQADEQDTNRFDEWAAKAKDLAEVAPDELQGHWDFLVEYSTRMSEAGGDLEALEEGDVKRNGEAGTAITQDAQERCGSGSAAGF